jgi:3-phenylpropionate/trans-cinnamate dioxygenase ferredoxin subunit
MKYIKVASAGELNPGGMKKVSFENTPVVLANIGGEFYAMDDTCPHMGGSLSAGKLEGANVVCPRHGATFDVRTGKAVKNGKLLFFTAKVQDRKSYPVKIVGADVMLGME